MEKKPKETMAQTFRPEVVRYVVNVNFNQAVLFMSDGSYLQFEHKTTDNRWARASTEQTMADSLCHALRLFRLNAKHLQLYFEDDSEAEFFAEIQ